jgi:soluble lytic murein transglycosylase-like protein
MQQTDRRLYAGPDAKAFALLLFPALHLTSTESRSRRRVARILRIVGAALALALPIACDKANAEPTSPVHAGNADPYLAFITETSQRFNIPASWISSVIRVESGGNSKAVSPKGAIGLMQIMPDTWAYLQSRYQLGTNLFDPHDNILAGAAYLRELYDHFGATGFLAAYNAGPVRFQDYLTGLRPLPNETKRYVAMLGQMLPDLHVTDAVSAMTDIPSWQRAALFTSVPAPLPPTDTAHPGRVPSAASTAPVSTLTPQSNGLFVAVRTAGEP